MIHQTPPNDHLFLEEQVFCQAIALTGDSRQRYIDQACKQQKLCPKRIEYLLRLDEEPDQLLDQKAIVCQLPESQPVTVGDHLGDYQLETCLGEGGMGQVFLASQQKPIRRQVAIKIIRHGNHSREVIRRFELEREALSLFDHPNLAKILDAGVTQDGQPFFAMEWVQGYSITRYCADQNSTLKQKLRLFADVCSAIHHAHQKGILHRDIKPNNVLVESHHEQPSVKVIDFGIAKALNESVQPNLSRINTQLGGLIGTIEYMSPEQIRSDGRGLDIRSDIYSLGVLLYQLLTNSVPFRIAPDYRLGLMDTLENILESEYESPSSRVARTRKEGDVSAGKHGQVQRLQPINDELDWITLKALNKDRELRYQSAASLRDDILAFLDGDIVTAMAPTRTYRFRKWFKRHRGLCIFALVIFVTLMSATLFSSAQAFRARRAERHSSDLVEQLRAKSIRLEQSLQLAEIGRKVQNHQLRKKKAELAFANAVKKSLQRMQVAMESSGTNGPSQGNAGYVVSMPPGRQTLLGSMAFSIVDLITSSNGWSTPGSLRPGADNPDELLFQAGLPPMDGNELDPNAMTEFPSFGHESMFGLGTEPLSPTEDLNKQLLPVFGFIELNEDLSGFHWTPQTLNESTLPFCMDLLEEQIRLLGERDTVVANTRCFIGQVQLRLNRYDEATEQFQQAIRIYHREKWLESELFCQLWIVRCYSENGKKELAKSLFRNVRRRLSRNQDTTQNDPNLYQLMQLYDWVALKGVRTAPSSVFTN